jgi:hypothetical protein
MPGIKPISNINEITFDNTWVPAGKFNSKDRLVDGNGNKISSDYNGRQYWIIEKRERSFSILERLGRGFLGIVAFVCTLGFGLFSKSVTNLFTKSKKNIRFALLESSTSFTSQTSSPLTEQNVSNKPSVKNNEPKEKVRDIASTIFPAEERTKRDEENLKNTEKKNKKNESLISSVQTSPEVKKEGGSKQADALNPVEFLTWLKEDSHRLGDEKNTQKLISIIKNEEVTQETIRDFYAGLSESMVLQILAFPEAANSFNAVNEKIIEKALILETNFIQALNKKCPHQNLELRTKIEKRTLGPSIFRHSMGTEEIQQIGLEFFGDLRESGRLLTKQEFIDQGHPEGAYWDKKRDLGRIQGANYIKRTAEELGLKHIKVPKKIAVLDEGVTSVQVTVSPVNLELSSSQITIFVENITPLERGTTREEVTEFLKILEATGFGDFLGDNFILGRNQQGEEGIYFINTEYMNFRHIPFLENNVAEGINRMVQKKDWDWINQLDRLGRYCSANRQRLNRYFGLYEIEDVSLLGNLLKTYVPEIERRQDQVEFTYIHEMAEEVLKNASDVAKEDRNFVEGLKKLHNMAKPHTLSFLGDGMTSTDPS